MNDSRSLIGLPVREIIEAVQHEDFELEDYTSQGSVDLIVPSGSPFVVTASSRR
jgi:hypothetical protein